MTNVCAYGVDISLISVQVPLTTADTDKRPRFFVSVGLWDYLYSPISAFAISYKRKGCQTKARVLN